MLRERPPSCTNWSWVKLWPPFPLLASTWRPWSTRTLASLCGTSAARTRSGLCETTTFKTHKASSLWLTAMTESVWMRPWGAHEDVGRRTSSGTPFCSCLLTNRTSLMPWTRRDHGQAGPTLSAPQELVHTGYLRHQRGRALRGTGLAVNQLGNQKWAVILSPPPPHSLLLPSLYSHVANVPLWCECQKLSPWSVTVCFTML